MIGSGCPALQDNAKVPDLFLFLEARQRRHWIALKKSLWRFFFTVDAEALDYFLSSKQGVSWPAHCTN